jgi:hypothetical protein
MGLTAPPLKSITGYIIVIEISHLKAGVELTSETSPPKYQIYLK